MTEIANTTEYDAWNGEGGRRWVANADLRDRVLQPIADVLLPAADLRPGEQVADVGCGCGAVTLAAARAVVPEGRVIGVDLSAPMLDVARGRARADGTTNAVLVHADAQTHAFDAGTLDVAISRFGTMFFADPVTAFTNLGRGLRAGGRICFATWQALDANEWLSLPGAALLPYADLPAADAVAPGMFAQSEPDVVRTTLSASGYAGIDLRAVDVTMTLGRSVDDATAYLAATGPGRAILGNIPEDDQPAALDAVGAALSAHADARGVHLGGAVWIVTAHRP